MLVAALKAKAAGDTEIGQCDVWAASHGCCIRSPSERHLAASDLRRILPLQYLQMDVKIASTGMAVRVNNLCNPCEMILYWPNAGCAPVGVDTARARRIRGPQRRWE